MATFASRRPNGRAIAPGAVGGAELAPGAVTPAKVVQQTWQPAQIPQFGVAWTASDSSWPSYYKDATGTVHLRGQATAVIDLFYVCGDGPAFPASAVLNLPAGYRPARLMELPAIFDGSPARVIVRPSGVVCRAGEADAGQYQAFDGVSFRAEG